MIVDETGFDRQTYAKTETKFPDLIPIIEAFKLADRGLLENFSTNPLFTDLWVPIACFPKPPFKVCKDAEHKFPYLSV